MFKLKRGSGEDSKSGRGNTGQRQPEGLKPLPTPQVQQTARFPSETQIEQAPRGRAHDNATSARRLQQDALQARTIDVPPPTALVPVGATKPPPTAPALRTQTTPPPGGNDEPPEAATRKLPPLPKRARSKRRPLTSFLLFVVLPLVAVAVYYYRYAPDIYVAEFRFAVTETTPLIPGRAPSANGLEGAAAGSGIASLFGSFSASTVTMHNYVVVDYLRSPRAIEDLSKRTDVRALLARGQARRCGWLNSDIDDLRFRFNGGGPSQIGTPPGQSGDPQAGPAKAETAGASWCGKPIQDMPMEEFAEYWKSLVTASYDPVTGLAIAKVRAFAPQDAYELASQLVTLAEELVNEIASRSQKDAVAFAEKEVDRAQKRLDEVRDRMLILRKKEGMIDPNRAGVSTNTELIKEVRSNLLQQQAEMEALRRQRLSPNAPVMRAMQAKIRATQAQLAGLENEVGNNTKDRGALTEVVDRFERLELESQYARQLLINALQAYDQSRANAAAQHLYLTPYVRPTMPESPTEPNRPLQIFLWFLSLLGIWLITLMLYRAVQDHAR